MELKFLIIIATNDSTVSHHSSVFVNLTCITLQICDEKYKFINVNAHHGGEGELQLPMGRDIDRQLGERVRNNLIRTRF